MEEELRQEGDRGGGPREPVQGKGGELPRGHHRVLHAVAVVHCLRGVCGRAGAGIRRLHGRRRPRGVGGSGGGPAVERIVGHRQGQREAAQRQEGRRKVQILGDRPAVHPLPRAGGHRWVRADHVRLHSREDDPRLERRRQDAQARLGQQQVTQARGPLPRAHHALLQEARSGPHQRRPASHPPARNLPLREGGLVQGDRGGVARVARSPKSDGPGIGQ
mmetsp:Transcript_44141/g.93970  ORF Transcript_44141/g.93970 Transcript_44141/m.93970 type:complete len:219 (-) Transcript_44141:527-1183(-)